MGVQEGLEELSHIEGQEGWWRGLEGVPGLPGAPQDEAGLTRKFETKPSCACAATAPWTWGWSSQPPPLALGVGLLLPAAAVYDKSWASLVVQR